MGAADIVGCDSGLVLYCGSKHYFGDSETMLTKTTAVKFLIGLTAMLATIGIGGEEVRAQDGFSVADKNGDGKIDKEELEAYAGSRLQGFDRWEVLMKALDKDGDGGLSESEFENRREVLRRVMGRMRQGNRSAGGRGGSGRGENAEPDALKVGEKAPVFELKSLDGKSEFNLADYRGKKPVVLIFGSYT